MKEIKVKHLKNICLKKSYVSQVKLSKTHCFIETVLKSQTLNLEFDSLRNSFHYKLMNILPSYKVLHPLKYLCRRKN